MTIQLSHKLLEIQNIMETRRYKRLTRTTTRKHNRHTSPLRSSYGTVTFPKGTRLYHASASELCTLPVSKSILFTTLHPSEWYMEDAYITVFELQTSIDLLFMVQRIQGLRILSALNNYLEPPANNLAKMNHDNVKQWIPYLQRESLSGWLSSVENKTAIEIAVINDPALLKIVECLPIKYNWANSKYNNEGELIPKNWGTTYPVSTTRYKMQLHSRYKPQIDAYVEKIAKEDPDGTAFSLMLKNANITYKDATIKKITWSIG